MSPPGPTLPLVPAARRLHAVVILLLALQLLIGAAAHPLAWGGLLLTLMAALKLLESRSSRDLQRACLAELMALGVAAVVSPDLGSTLLQLATALLVIAALLGQEGGDRASLGQALRRSLQLGVAALPLLVLLFVLMPRIGPLWSVPGQTTGRTGLSDQLEAGTISELVQDPTPALRISYLTGAPPAPAERYWRVLVLDHFDGRRWSASPPPPRKAQRTRRANGPRADQIWVAEASPLAALPWSGRGDPTDPALTIQRDGVLLDGAGGAGRRRYGFRTSGAVATWQRLEPTPGDLTFRAGTNPRLENLGGQWARTLTPDERVSAARRLMESQGLRYTLSPPTLPPGAPLDALLFETRAGFCEHFASTFTALMRAAAVPARVVIGYQGGEWVPAGRWGDGFLEIRQRDAHAWSEVWLPPQGWVRIDPTAWVAPGRIDAGLEHALGGNGLAGDRLARLLPWWRGLTRTWTRLDLAWTRWVLAFDGDSQVRLLGRWHPWQGVLLMLGAALVLAPALWWLQRQPVPNRMDRTRHRLERALRPLRQRALEPAEGETLQAFAERIAADHPPLADPLAVIVHWYALQRFAQQPLPRRVQIEGQRHLRTAERQLIRRLRRWDRTPVERIHPRRRP